MPLVGALRLARTEGLRQLDIFVDDDLLRHVLPLAQFPGPRAQQGAQGRIEPLEPPVRRQPRAEADEDYFAAIVRGVVGGQRDIDGAIKARLASNWRLERLDSTLRALLRAGAWELRERQDVPREIVIDEYVELAKAFFDDAEAKFVNAALDGVARDARAS